jgi:plasmid stabilization system protein ParE
MRRVVWSPTAIRDLARIRAFVARFSPVAAARITSDLQAAGETLAAHADRGRPAPGGKRELATLRPYLIRYRVTTDDVRIIRIRHAARRPL